MKTQVYAVNKYEDAVAKDKYINKRSYLQS